MTESYNHSSLFRRSGMNYITLAGETISLDRMEQERLLELLGERPIEDLNHVVRCLFEIWLKENQIKVFKVKSRYSAYELLTSLKSQTNQNYN